MTGINSGYDDADCFYCHIPDDDNQHDIEMQLPVSAVCTIRDMMRNVVNCDRQCKTLTK